MSSGMFSGSISHRFGAAAVNNVTLVLSYALSSRAIGRPEFSQLVWIGKWVVASPGEVGRSRDFGAVAKLSC